MTGHEFNILQFLFEAKEKLFQLIYKNEKYLRRGLLTKINERGSSSFHEKYSFLEISVSQSLPINHERKPHKSQTNNWQKATLSLKKWSPIKSPSKGSYITPAVNYDGKASWASLTRQG